MRHVKDVARAAVVAAALALVAASAAQADYPAIPISIGTPGEGYKQKPAIDGQIVVWEDYLHANGNSNILGYNIHTSSQFAVYPDPSYNDCNPRIDGNIVVWDLNSYYIRAYDLSTTQLIAVPTVPYYSQLPDVAAGVVVYSDTYKGIYARQMSSGLSRTICSATAYQNSRARTDGRTVVWKDDRGIYGYDLTGSIFSLEFLVSSSWGWDPVVEGDVIVWAKYIPEKNESDIYGYHISSGQEFSICTAAGAQYSPAISGHLVVWCDARNGDRDIFGYDLLTGMEFAICTSPGDQMTPDVSGNTVVWTDYCQNSGGDIYAAVIPEPATLSLLALGSLLALRRRRQFSVSLTVRRACGLFIALSRATAGTTAGCRRLGGRGRRSGASGR